MVFLYLGHGNGTFEQNGIEAFDTRPDIEMGSDQRGWGTFHAYDVNHDGILDVVSAVAEQGPIAGNSPLATLQYFQGTGSGTFVQPKSIDPNLITPTAFTVPPSRAPLSTVRNRIPDGDVNGDGRVDNKDVNFVLVLRNTPAAGPADPWDLDRDGNITVLDARRMVLKCTTSLCR